MPSDLLNLGYLLGELQQTDRDHARRIGKLEEQREQLKSEVDRLKTWGERAAILVVLYLLGAGLHLGAPAMAPVMSALLRSLIGGLRGG